MAERQHTPASSISSITSPTFSTWSRGHSSKSSGSSISVKSASIPARDSFDTYCGTRKLEDVREEDDIYNRQYCSFDEYTRGDQSLYLHGLSAVSPLEPSYSLTDQDAPASASSSLHQSKRQKSLGISSRFSTLSKRWKSRSGVLPQLSIVTSPSRTPSSSSMPAFDTGSSWYNRSLSSPSHYHQEVYSPASMHSFAEDTIPESEVVPIYIDQKSGDDQEEDEGQATTPLLPPTMMSLQKRDSPIQSPLQSPSIAPTPVGQNRPSMDQVQFSPYLPSPPLSARPSFASMPQSRFIPATHDIPPLQLVNDPSDPWSARLGHADFSIHPEPYMPETMDLPNYKEFRSNWEQARKQYAQHIARTIEHYGSTSKVYKLTEEKWNSIDDRWKAHNAQLSRQLSPQLARLSDDPQSPDSPMSLLEKPVTRVVLPTLDKSGKFPEIGDSDIVGPLSVGVAKVPELQRGLSTPPTSPRKRAFKKIFDIFGR